MHDFCYVGKKLFCERVAVESLVKRFGTPLYVYSQHTLTDHYQKLTQALASLDHLVCYAVKANSNSAVIRTLSNLGSGFDIVSEGELRRVVAAGGDPRKCVFAGVGKTEREIAYALEQGIYSFNVESEPELIRINNVAQKLKCKAPVAVRVNPNVDAGTHAKITTGTYENKFGIAFEQIEGIYKRASQLKSLQLRGIQMHIGSQLTEVAPFEQAVQKLAPLAAKLKDRYGLEFFSVGGGLGIIYKEALESSQTAWWRRPAAKRILTPSIFADRLLPMLSSLNLKILLEPGRFIVGNAGILVTRVEYVKRTGRKNFVIVDAAMNDLIRPAFYDSFHQIVPLAQKNGGTIKSDVVGPICESGDYFAKERLLPRMAEGEYLALLSAGAYGSVMGSNYNSRSLSAEVMVNGNKAALVRSRQPVEQIWAGESVPDWLK